MTNRTFKKQKENIIFYLKAKKGSYGFVIICLFVGIILGTISCSYFTDKNINIKYFNTLVSSFNIQGISFKELYYNSIYSIARIFVIIWLSGWFIWLIPINAAEIILKGFGIGYTISFLSLIGGFKGLALSFALLIGQIILLIPPILAFSVEEINRSINRYKTKNRTKKTGFDIKKISLYFCIFGNVILYVLFESLIIPRLISPILGVF